MRNVALSDALYDYVVRMGVRETRVQRELRAATAKLPMAGMQIGPDQAAFLQLLVRLLRARRCLEIGTFTGYSALSMALALPPRGRIVCCDVSEEWTALARPVRRGRAAAGRRHRGVRRSRGVDGARPPLLEAGSGGKENCAPCCARPRNPREAERAVRSSLHRCRQAQLREVLRALPAPGTQGRADRGRQHAVERGGHRSAQADGEYACDTAVQQEGRRG